MLRTLLPVPVSLKGSARVDDGLRNHSDSRFRGHGRGAQSVDEGMECESVLSSVCPVLSCALSPSVEVKSQECTASFLLVSSRLDPTCSPN
jgi:hypothetical protein